MLSSYFFAARPEIALATDALLLVLLVCAAITDLWRHKIYNFVTYPAMAAGLALHFWAGGLPGLGSGFAGLVVGGILLLPFFVAGGMGAGDVKLMAAIGAIKGAYFAVWVLFFGGLLGGAMAMGIVIWRGEFLKTMKQTLMLFTRAGRQAARQRAQQEDAGAVYLPYGLALSLGGIWALVSV